MSIHQSSQEKVLAPFTPDQVESLNGFQKRATAHPFTCPYRSDGDHEVNAVLIAKEEGWVCPHCPYTQNWAHTFMANNEWRELAKEFEELGFGYGR